MSEQNRQVDAFTIRDPDTEEVCWVGVRIVGGRLLLAVSRQADGDVEVQLSRSEADRLARALTAGFDLNGGE